MTSTASVERPGWASRYQPAREALAFLTPLIDSHVPPSPRSTAFFPAIGAILGLAEGLVWQGARRTWTTFPAAVIVVGADAVLTGALHLDGLADTADGLFAHVPDKDRLEIMAEPAVGSFGATALILSIVTRAFALGAAEPSPLFLAALLCSSRSLMVLGMRTLPYARAQGLATTFLPAEQEGPDAAVGAAVCGIAFSLLAAGVARGRRGVSGVLAGSLAGSAVLLAARRRLGGFTGDVLGAAGAVCETVGVVVSARR